MPACEYCWERAGNMEKYYEVMAQAEREGWPCTKDTEEGARLRAGRFWDEKRKIDGRAVPS